MCRLRCPCPSPPCAPFSFHPRHSRRRRRLQNQQRGHPQLHTRIRTPLRRLPRARAQASSAWRRRRPYPPRAPASLHSRLSTCVYCRRTSCCDSTWPKARRCSSTWSSSSSSRSSHAFRRSRSQAPRWGLRRTHRRLQPPPYPLRPDAASLPYARGMCTCARQAGVNNMLTPPPSRALRNRRNDVLSWHVRKRRNATAWR